MQISKTRLSPLSTCLYVTWSFLLILVLYQASELAEHTAKIALLEDAWKRKEEEASTWQLKVRALTVGKLQRTVC